MSTIVTRAAKGSPLSNTEVDANFTNLNTDKLELGGTYSAGTANGVAYLNGSKVLTSGGTLTFDGSQLDVPAGSAAVPSLSTTADVNTGLFFPTADTLAVSTGGSERLRIDSAGILGLGVVPSAWTAGARAIQLGTLSAVSHSANGVFVASFNSHESSPGVFAYSATGATAQQYRMSNGGGHIWFTAPSGTAGNTISFTQAMTLDASGRLLIDTTSSRINGLSSGTNLQVEGLSSDASVAVVRNSADVSGAFIVLGKSRGTAVGSFTSVASGDLIGQVSFQGADGTSLISAAAIRCEVDGTPGTNDMPGRLVFSTTADGALSPTERARIDSAGNVGIGTTTPSSTLDLGPFTGGTQRLSFEGAVSLFPLRGGGNISLAFGYQSSSTTSNQYQSSYATSTARSMIAVGSLTGIRFFTDPASTVAVGTDITPTERMRIDTAGNLGLGVVPSAWSSGVRAVQIGAGAAIESRTNAGYAALSSNQFINAVGTNIYIASEAATKYDQTGGQHRFFTAPSGTAGNAISFTQAMTLDASGNLGIGTTSPGTRLHVVGTYSNGQVRIAGSSGQRYSGVSILNDTNTKYQIYHDNTVGCVDHFLPAGSDFFRFFTNATERARIDSSGNLIQTVNTTAATLATNNTLTFSIVDNSTLRVSVRGSDGTTRTATIALT